MAIDENKKKAVKDSAESVKEEEAEKSLISEEEAELSSEDNDETETKVTEDPETEISEAEETEDSDEEEEEEKDEKSASKAKKDPIPTIMIVLIYAIIIGAILFYVIPTVCTPSFGYTLEAFNEKLEKTDISTRMQSQYTTLTPQFKLVDKNSIKEIWSIKGEVEPEYQAKLNARFKPFVKTYAATEELENVLVEANTRITDGQLTRMCIYCTYDNSHLSMMMVHFGAVLCTFADVPFTSAVSILMDTAAVSNKEGLYTARGDIAFKLSVENIAGQQAYMKLEVLPLKALKPEQIKTTLPLETAAPSAETTASAADTTAPAAESTTASSAA